MPILISVLQLISIFAIPALILKYRDKPLNRRFGAIGMAYFWGLAVALGVYALNRLGVSFSLNADIGEIGSYVAIGVAIPLLLFGCSFKQIKRLTKPVLLSFLSLACAVVITTAAVYYIFGRDYPFSDFICAMAVGLYTGGTPNFISIGLSLGADFELIAVGNLCDMIVGGVFYVFLLLLAKPLLLPILGKGKDGALYMHGSGAENADELTYTLSRSGVRNIVLALGCAILGAGAGVLLWLAKGAVDGTLTAYLVPGVMICVTVLGIALSFVPKIHSVKENTAVGQYLVLVFSFALASCLDLTKLSGEFLGALLLLSVITVVTFLLHTLFCRLLGIGTDCALVTLIAGVYGPAFVPAITKQIKNDDLTAPGLICGALGYAIGTFLGLLVFLILI